MNQPIVIGHAFGDQYKVTDFIVPGPGTKLVFEGENGDSFSKEVYNLKVKDEA